MIYGVDIDGVLLDLNGAILRDINARHGTTYNHEHITSWNFEDIPGLAAHAEFIWQELYPDDAWHMTCEPVAGALEGLKALQRAGSVHLITARLFETARVTVRWLKKHGIDNVSVNHVLFGKAGACADIGIDVLIEDGPHNALAVANAGIPVILFDRAYNRDICHERIYRVSGWTEALQYLGLAE